MILINGTPLNVTMFPDKTSQVWKVAALDIPNTNWVNITWRYENEAEVMHLAQLKMLIDKYAMRATLNITYLPYARQDKEVTNESTFALRTFANILNSLRFNKVIITDPHSDVALQLINNSFATYPLEQLCSAIDKTKCDVVCYPDKGAVYKYTNVYDYKYIYGEKTRNQSTGVIEKYKLIGNAPGTNVLIVDDLCDGGATFIALSKELFISGAKEVNLFVTHGIFSKGIEVLKQSGINRIFTKDGEL